MTEAMAFWSVILPPKGKPVQQEVESTPNVLSSIHVTGLALGPAPKEGPHVVTLEYNGTNTVLATLEAPKVRQWRLDIALDQTVKLRNTGDSEVHLYGYQVSTAVNMDDSDEADDEDDEDYELDAHDEGEEAELEDDEDEDEDEEDDDKGTLQANGKLSAKAKGKAKPKPDVDAMDTEGDEDEDEDEEDEEEDDSEDGIPQLGELGSEDLIGEADDEDEEEDEKQKPVAKVGTKRGPQTPQLEKPPKQLKQEPPKSAPPKPSQQPSQKAPPKQPTGGDTKQVPVKSGDKPQPVKVEKDGGAPKPEQQQHPKSGKAAQKDKGGDKGVKPEAEKAAKSEKPKDKAAEKKAANAEQKDAKGSKGGDKAAKKEGKGPQSEAKQAPTPTGSKAPANEEEYRAALVKFLKEQKCGVKLSLLGSALKRPAGMEKLAPYLKKHSDTFAVEGDEVKLTKQ